MSGTKANPELTKIWYCPDKWFQLALGLVGFSRDYDLTSVCVNVSLALSAQEGNLLFAVQLLLF